jgi:hypothetical protein
MYEIVECVGCGLPIGSDKGDDVLCSKCEELETLRIKVERYEKALKLIVANPTSWETSYGAAYTESVRIALEALNLKEE